LVEKYFTKIKKILRQFRDCSFPKINEDGNLIKFGQQHLDAFYRGIPSCIRAP
jgi:hypothetical protein